MEKKLPVPAGYQTVMPYLIIKEAAKFIEFMKIVFGATETGKTMRDENIIMHGEITIGDCTIMFADSTAQFTVNTAALFIYVDDANATYKKALEAGAVKKTELSHQSYGLSGGIQDPFGNTWWITSINE